MQPLVEFPCDQCGACCRTIGCDKLTEDNLCSIYETRPNSCRVDWLCSYLNANKEEFYKKHKEICNFLRSNEKKQKSL